MPVRLVALRRGRADAFGPHPEKKEPGLPFTIDSHKTAAKARNTILAPGRAPVHWAQRVRSP
jgi:hypothetical protein